MRYFVALCLFFSASLLHSESLYTLTESQKTYILNRLENLEHSLKQVNEKLAQSESLITKLEANSKLLENDLETVRQLLSISDENLEQVERKLTEASQTLITLEKQLKRYQQSKLIEMLMVGTMTCLITIAVVVFI